ncbi:hypothetical protein Tco_0514013 [Tanacetum coccineum]
MDNTRAQQKALDDELVAPANRLKIGKSNLRLSSDLKSKEPTLQVALDALKLTPFYNAFVISADVPKIYMQEFWVTVSRYHSSLRFKLNGKSHTINVDIFRDILKICPIVPGQRFEELPLEEAILSFIRDLGHTREIKFLSDVNVNHIHQPWRSLAAIINKCLSGKTTTLENIRLSRAQILWGMYHNKKVDYAYLLWEDLVFQVENKNSKKNNDMYYPRFTKVIVDYFMAKDQEIPRRNKMFWHHARDDFMFTTVRVISKHQDTQVYGAILPQHLTNQAMLESEAYKTYHAYATSKKTPRPKSTKKKADSESSPKTKSTQAPKGKRIKTSDKQSAAKSKGLTVLSEAALSEADQLKLATKRSKKEFHSSHASGSSDGVDIQSKVPDEQQQNVSGASEGAGDKPEVLDVPEYKSKSEEESWTFSQGEDDDEEKDEHDSDNNNDENDSENDNDDEDDDQENDKGNDEERENDDDEIPDEEDNQEDDDQGMGGAQEEKEDEELYGDLNINLDRQDAEMTDAQQTEEMNEVVKVAVQIQSNRLRKEAQAENDEFLKQIDSNINAIIKDQVKAQVSKILPKVEKYVTDTLGAELVTRSSNHPQTSYAVVASLSEFELKKILIDKIKESKSMYKSEVQKNLYNALIESYNSDKDIFGSYGDGRSEEDQAKKSHQKKLLRRSPSLQVLSEDEHGLTGDDLEEPFHLEFNTGNDDESPERTKTIDNRPPQSWMTQLAQASGTQSSFNEFLATPIDFPAFVMNWLKIKNLTQDVLTGPTYELNLDWHNPEGRPYPHDLSKPLPLIQNARGRQVIPFDYFINNDLEYLKDKVPRSIWSPVQVVYDKHAYWGTYHWGPKRQRFDGYATNMETSHDVCSRHKIIAITSLKIMEFFGYKHLEEITVQRQNDQLYKFREGNFKRLHRQDIEDMLLLLVQGKLTNLNLDKRFALNKKINLSKPDSYRSDLRKMTPYTAYYDIQGIIYQDDMNRNRLMRTDELHKFSDSTLNHVHTTLNDIATGIQMAYLPKRK